VHPGTGDQVNRCVLFVKEPEEPAHERHGEVAERCDAAGDLLLVPGLRDLPRYPCAEIQGHCDYFFKDTAGYIASDRFEYFGSYFGNPGVMWGRMSKAVWLT